MSPRDFNVNFQSVGASFLYGSSSIGMIFLNKNVLTHFTISPSLLMVIQFSFTVIVLNLLKICRIIQFQDPQIPLLKKFMIPALMYSTTVICSLIALKIASVPIYTLIKRTTPCHSLILSIIILKIYPNRIIVLAVGLTLFGTILTGFGDLLFDLKAYVLGITASVAQAAYLTYIQKYGIENGIDTFTALHTNSLLCIPITFFSAALQDELHLNFSDQNDYFFLGIGLILVFGLVLNLSMFWCTIVNSAVATCIVGVAKGVVTIVLGFIFDTQPLTSTLVSGITFSMIGSILYTIEKMKLKLEVKNKNVKQKKQSHNESNLEQKHLMGEHSSYGVEKNSSSIEME